MGMLLTRHYADRENNREIGAAKKVAPKVPEEKKVEKPTIAVSDIKAMNGTKLRKLAAENGIENPEDLTVGELKAILIEKFS